MPRTRARPPFCMDAQPVFDRRNTPTTSEKKGPRMSEQRIEELSVNTIRTLAMDAVQKANSGHPGAPMGLAPAAYVLWQNHLRHNPKNPRWDNQIGRASCRERV